MAYFDNARCQYDRHLREMEHERSWREYEHNYGQYKLDKPKNPITIRSIYTEDESQFRAHTIEDEDDIHKFIENSKTLREKIYEKLDKKKKLNKNTKARITETTFRPNQMAKPNLKQNITANNLSNRKSIHHEEQSHRNMKTDSKRVLTQIDEARSLWKQKGQLNFSQLSFYERQQKTLTNKKQYTKKVQDQQKQKQMQGCTFKPKLTKYQPKRN